MKRFKKISQQCLNGKIPCAAEELPSRWHFRRSKKNGKNSVNGSQLFCFGLITQHIPHGWIQLVGL